MRARHILVADEATAKAVVAELAKGGDFAALSTKHSKDPGAARSGGDLGFFKKEDMVPEFAEAAFGLKSNEVSKTPVKTQFGWHVIQVEDVRTATFPPYEQVKPQIQNLLQQQEIQKVIADLRAKAKVE